MNGSFERINKSGAVYFRYSEISAQHGFSTRLGGVSQIPHLASMNLGRNLSDDPEAVAENYRIISDAIGLPANSLVYTKQIHSADVLTVGKADIGKTYACDGLVTAEKGVSVGVLTADCVPILFWCENTAVGAAHAGWRGTVGGIQQNTVKALETLGAKTEDIKVAIGASIHRCCYEVGNDFFESVSDLRGRDFAARHIAPAENGKFHADLLSMNVELLLEAGIREENMGVSPYCTACDPNLFFSHRASGGKRGVMGSFISLY